MVYDRVVAAVGRGIRGRKRKKQMLFSFNARLEDGWSEDSSDSDYLPTETDGAPPQPPTSAHDAGGKRAQARKSTPKAPHRKSKRLREPAVNGAASVVASSVVASSTSCDRSVEFDSRVAAVTAEDINKKDPWGKLMPPELLLKIFGYSLSDRCLPMLCSICRVCKLWYQVGSDAQLWTKLDLSYGWIKNRQRLLPCLVETGRLAHTKELSLSLWASVDPKFLMGLSKMCPTLEELCIADCTNAREEGVRLVLKEFPRLKVLDISSSAAQYGAEGLSKRHMTVIQKDTFRAATSLTELSIAGITCDFAVIETIATHCTRLEVLDISNVMLRGSKASHILSLIAQMQQHLVKLRVLRMTRALCSVPLRNPSLVSESAGFPLLEEFSCAADTRVSQASATVASLYHYSGDILIYIVGKSPRLRLLDIHGWSASILPVLARLPTVELEYLYISGLIASVARSHLPSEEIRLNQWSKTLLDVDLSWMSVSVVLLEHIFSQIFVSDSSLRTISVCGLPISNRHVRHILTSCPRLTCLDLSSCHGLTRGIKRKHDGRVALASLDSALKDSHDATL